MLKSVHFKKTVARSSFLSVIFNITSADFVLMSADVVLKMTTILKEMSNCLLKMNGLYGFYHNLGFNTKPGTYLKQTLIDFLFNFSVDDVFFCGCDKTSFV